MVVDGLIVLTVIKVTALSVPAVPMVMELRRVIRGLEMTGDVVEPRGRTRTRTARRRRAPHEKNKLRFASSLSLPLPFLARAHPTCGTQALQPNF